MNIPNSIDLQKVLDNMEDNRPHEDMYNEWFYGYFNLSNEQKAQERLADSKIYQRYVLAKKYGIQLYNVYGVNR